MPNPSNFIMKLSALSDKSDPKILKERNQIAFDKRMMRSRKRSSRTIAIGDRKHFLFVNVERYAGGLGFC